MTTRRAGSAMPAPARDCAPLAPGGPDSRPAPQGTLLRRSSREIALEDHVDALQVELGELRRARHEADDRAMAAERREQDALLRAADVYERLVHDPLTGALNRVGLEEIAGDWPTMPPAALVALDLDRFKHINDTYGHAAGDAVLAEVGKRLRLVPFATAVRLGGDEFALVVDSGRDPGQVIAWAMDEIRRQITIPGAVGVWVTASIGWAPVRPGVGLRELLARADLAAYHAKVTGSSVRWYPGMRMPAAPELARRRVRSVAPCTCFGSGCPGCTECAA